MVIQGFVLLGKEDLFLVQPRDLAAKRSCCQEAATSSHPRMILSHRDEGGFRFVVRICFRDLILGLVFWIYLKN